MRGKVDPSERLFEDQGFGGILGGEGRGHRRIPFAAPG